MIAESETIQRAGNEIYPDNALTVSIFADMLTQWRVGMSGATGLDYAALPAVLGIRQVGADEQREVFDGVKIMEAAALKSMRVKAK